MSGNELWGDGAVNTKKLNWINTQHRIDFNSISAAVIIQVKPVNGVQSFTVRRKHIYREKEYIKVIGVALEEYDKIQYTTG